MRRTGWDAAPPRRWAQALVFDLSALIARCPEAASAIVVIMNNGGFGGIHEQLLARFAA
jgi:hypothetical protein